MVDARMVDRLHELVLLESPTGDADAIRTVSERVAGWFEALGAENTWHRTETGDHVVCAIPGTSGRENDAPALFLTHADTVWPVGTLDDMPWRADAVRVYGPGCYDMKGGIVVLHEALAGVGRRAHRPLTIVVVADEEIGSPTARPLIEELAGGAHAVIGLEPPHPDGSLKTSRWGSTRIALTVDGRASHAALDPAAGVSATDELVDQLLRVRTLTGGIDGVLCNLGTITGGDRTNVVADRARAELGLRFENAEVERTTLEKLSCLTPIREGAVVRVELLSNRPAWGPDARHDHLLAGVRRAAASVGQRIDGQAASGAADTNITGWLGVPTIDGFGPRGQGAHAADEQIVASSLAERAELLAAVITAL